MTSVRLDWDEKPTHVERLHLPFQTVETINESRATRERDRGALFGGNPRPRTDRNVLIWGDNKLVMSSLLKEYAGAVKLVYIDPPFDTGTDFSFRETEAPGTWSTHRMKRSTPRASTYKHVESNTGRRYGLGDTTAVCT